MAHNPAAAQALCERYLLHARVEKRLAERTLSLYAIDLHKLRAHAAEADLGLEQVQNTQIRRWAAQLHSRGRRARGFALIL